MQTYKVYGDKVHQYYTVVDAVDSDEAYDLATADDVNWFEVESDDTIQPHTVELQDELDNN